MENNKVHNIDFLNNTLPDKCANLIIADPPYFEVKGEFDFVWKSFDDYLKDVECWAKECKRLLADNGTLFWYGHAKKIAYVQVIFDKYFKIENHITWHVFDRQTNKGVENYRCFAPVTERILMYSNEVDMTGLEQIKLDINNFKPLRNYFKELQLFISLSLKKINDTLGHRKAEHGFYWNSTQWDLPTVETYNQLIETFKINQWNGFKEYETLRKEYEELRKEYEELRRPFNNVMKLTDVMKFSQEGHITGNYNHDTVKPEKLTRALILTCSRKDDLIVVPFAGSGTECAMAAKEKRQFVGFEINANYSKIANERAAKILSEPTLF